MPSLNEIANAISRQYNWNIIPCGNYALNLIGLATKVPSKIIYISNRPYKEYSVRANIIIFKHSTTKEIQALNNKILISIQALKEIGKNNISADVIKKISQFLNKDDKKTAISGFRTTL